MRSSSILDELIGVSFFPSLWESVSSLFLDPYPVVSWLEDLEDDDLDLKRTSPKLSPEGGELILNSGLSVLATRSLFLSLLLLLLLLLLLCSLELLLLLEYLMEFLLVAPCVTVDMIEGCEENIKNIDKNEKKVLTNEKRLLRVLTNEKKVLPGG